MSVNVVSIEKVNLQKNFTYWTSFHELLIVEQAVDGWKSADCFEEI